MAQVADALITTERSKTLSALYRSIVGDPCHKSAADTFREAPWTADDIRVPLLTHLVQLIFKLAEELGLDKQVFLSLEMDALSSFAFYFNNWRNSSELHIGYTDP